MEQKKKRTAHPLYVSILLLLMAVAAATAATMAWLSIADSTRVRSMSMDVTSGVSLRFDLDAHNTFDEYVKTLNFSQISDWIAREKGFDMSVVPLEPVTTSDCVNYTFEHGNEALASSGVYLEFELNFMSNRDMIVHLTSKGDSDGSIGTAVSSDNGALPGAMRISFTTDGTTWIYNPGMGDVQTTEAMGNVFGLPAATAMTCSNKNAMFSLKADENKKVLVHVWLEGTDAACTDDLIEAGYTISLRFEGTDENNQLFQTENVKEKAE